MNKELEARLTTKNIKPTAMRILVLDYLNRHASAVSLKDLEENLESTDRITLFRTLKTFEEHKIIHSIDDGSGSIKYALCAQTCECDYPQDLHVHFYCKVCFETKCLPKIKIPAINLPEHYAPEEANVVVKGICDGCMI
ncbi:Fur family transcriptional regulator [Chryseosolibacter indicus]|uniref:Transcriptional repressor n=1 Tax=Chryseosolibacter indicus TaxID=2782351 RepID=A0ABS5VVR7_9BACT|nr:transcriptional repressor [Chryseosolibacter indicus]MBT1705528.1 transcriptional repressor [Chryseosolibacter indicus]